MITCTIQDKQVLAMLAAAVARGRDLSRPMNAISQKMRGDALTNFRVGGDFPGPAWKKSIRAELTGGQTLVENAILRNSIHADSGATFARIGTDVKYAAVHQFGHPGITPKTRKGLRFQVAGRWVTKQIVVIPARPFMPVDAQGNLKPATMRFAIEQLGRHLSA